MQLRILFGLIVSCSLVGITYAGVIEPSTDPAHLAAAVGRDYSAAMFSVGDSSHNAGTVTLIDLPWSNVPWVIGAKHALDYTGQQVNDNYEVVFGQSSTASPGERIAIEEFRLKGTGGLYSTDDVFLGRLERRPMGVQPIPLYLEDLDVGMIGTFTGSGDIYDGNGPFLGYDGERRTGQFRIRTAVAPIAGHIYSRFQQPGHPQYLPLGMGGAPGYSGSPVEMMLSSGELGIAAITNFVGGGFHYGADTVALRIDEIYPWIESETIPEPATLSLLLVGGVFVIRRRRA